MSIKSLTPEIIWCICRYVCFPEEGYGYEYKGLAPFSTISRSWQAVVEEATFAHLSFTQHGLADARRIITPARQHLVSSIKFHIQLNSYDESARLQIETQEEQEQNSSIFTKAVQDAFHLIKSWEPASRRRRWLQLFVWSPSDINRYVSIPSTLDL